MYGDFSRLTFDRTNSYSGVWNQQGRMQLDADLNEQTAILLDWMRTLAKDFIGPAGGHIQEGGFEVGVDPDSGDLTLGVGHYYVDGIRCHVPPPGWGGGPVTYRTLQPDDPDPPDMPYLVYLRVWERSVNQLLNPTLLEPALGPTCPDTTIRTQVAWSLAFTTPPAIAKPGDLIGAVADQFAAMNEPVRPLLQARVSTGGGSDDPEEAATIAGYSGLENQLYRVEIHRGSGDLDQSKFDLKNPPTFKWSRDNGSAEFGFEADTLTPDAKTGTSTLILTGAALPGRPTLNKGDCVEIIDDSWRPFDSPGPLLEVTKVEAATQTVTLAALVEASATAKTALLRRWDGASGEGEGIPVELSNSPQDGWIEIENGIEIRFPATNDARFQRGDFWLIPARAATARIYGPTMNQPDGARPYGPERCYAPLAQIDMDGGKATPTELRTLFTHLAWPDAQGGST
jgi:hypothetical protein